MTQTVSARKLVEKHQAQGWCVCLVLFLSSFLAFNVCAADKLSRDLLMPKLVAAINKVLDDGETLKVFLNILGKSADVKVRRADASGLTVDLEGNDFPVQWEPISDREITGIARRVAGGNGARLLLAAQFAVAFDFPEDASWLLAKAREADPALAADVLAVAALLPNASPRPASVPATNAPKSSGGDSNAAGQKTTAATASKDHAAESNTGGLLPTSGGAPSRSFTPTQTAGPKDYLNKIERLKPGDVLLLTAGTYTSDLRLVKLNGTKDQPIVVAGPASGPRAVFVADERNNTVELSDCSFLQVCNLELDGKGLDGPFGVSNKDGTVHDITIDGLYIHDYNGSQQTDGISTKRATWNWVIRNNVIERVGTGMYLGNSNGSDAFVNGVIENNLIVDTVGYNIQIKHQNSRPEIPGVSRATTIIRHNVFVKSKWYEKNDGARPNLLVGHAPQSGVGVDDQFLIYGNFFWKNPKEALFQGEGHIAFFDNVCVNPDNRRQDCAARRLLPAQGLVALRA